MKSVAQARHKPIKSEAEKDAEDFTESRYTYRKERYRAKMYYKKGSRKDVLKDLEASRWN